MIPELGGGLVSCLMVTQAKRWTEGIPVGARAYLDQDWFNRELVMVTKDPHPDMAAFVSTFPGANVRLFDVSEEAPETTIGGLRQIAVEMASGEFVATWDDDDVSASDRIAAQVALLTGLPLAEACVLARMRVDDERNGRRFISPIFEWEPTLLARREAMPPYDPARTAPTGEDFWVVQAFRHLAVLDRPELYTYRIHGTNIVGHKRADDWFRLRTGEAWS